MFSLDSLRSDPDGVAPDIEKAIEQHGNGDQNGVRRTLQEGWQAAAELEVGYSDRLRPANATAAIAETMAALGFVQDARKTFRRADRLYENPPNSSKYSSLGMGWGQSLAAVEISTWLAIGEFRLALKACRKMGNLESRIYSLMDIGEAADEAGEASLARKMFRRALKTANKVDDRVMREVRTAHVRTRMANLPAAQADGSRAVTGDARLRGIAIVGNAPKHVRDGNPQGIDVLLAGLKAKDREIVHAAIDELADLCSGFSAAPGAVDALIDAVDHFDWYVRNKAVDKLSSLFFLYGDEEAGRLGDRAAAEDAILLALGDRHLPTRAMAAELLKYVRRPETTDALIALLKKRSLRERLLKRSESMEVRANAARTLGMLGDPGAIPVLLNVLQSRERGSVRANAAEALGLLGDTDILRPLAIAIGDPDSVVGYAAAGAFVDIERRAGLR